MGMGMGMGSFLLRIITALLLVLSSSPTFAHNLYIDSVSPNFTASYFDLIDQSGVFLVSRNRTFRAEINNLSPGGTTYYLAVFHVASNTLVWSANRNAPVSDSAKLTLSETGLTISNDAGKPIWSAPPNSASTPKVAFLQLQDSGNLLLLDHFNSSLWEGFDHPTDTIIIGQRLRVGQSLVADAEDGNVSAGDYRFTVTGGDDAIMQWNGMTYWKLSMEPTAIKNSNMPVSYMGLNGSGLFLFGTSSTSDGLEEVVIRVTLPAANSLDFRFAKMGDDGRFTIMTYRSNNWKEAVEEFGGPGDRCRIPFVCGKIGLCAAGICSCPPGFHGDPKIAAYCSPTDPTLSLPPATFCDGPNGNGSLSNSSQYSYIRLGIGMDYFANDFTGPVENNVNLYVCEHLCSAKCSCLAIFHGNSSGSCYLLENQLGSIMSSSTTESDRLGYIKAIVTSSPVDPDAAIAKDQKTNFPLVGLVLLPSSGVLLILVVMGILWSRIRNRRSRVLLKLSRGNSSPSPSSSAELEIIYIPGLPVRFEYEELLAATENFGTQIGSGGFGTVYKGTLADKTVVAVKKITCMGAHGKKEFCTEIAIIGKVHHINLVKLKGFCAQRRQRFLVYEFMNGGSLDRTLFVSRGPVLEWQERFEIALGTARGLAYLHSGCEHKIIHCDVKPENILLHENLQVKISDFGLSKLLSPEQSGLFTTMRGTRGYLAPEWLTSSVISDKTDVYSYGMVLLELVRGRKNCTFERETLSHNSSENESSGGNGNGNANGPSSSNSSGLGLRPIYFPLFALEMHEKGRYLELVDPRLEGRATREEVEKLVRVALCCVHEEPMLRPTMANVVGMLEGGLPLGKPRVESLNFLRFYGRRFTEASAIEGYNEQNEMALYPVQGNGNLNSSASGSHHSFSYMSSQQLSGPR